MSEATFVLYGVKFTQEDWVPLLGNLLVMIGISLTLYIALFIGNEEEAAPKDAEKINSPKKTTKVEKPTTPQEKPASAKTETKEAKAPPSTQKKAKKEITTPTTTPKKKASKKVEDLGHIMSPDGRRSMRLKTKVEDSE